MRPPTDEFGYGFTYTGAEYPASATFTDGTAGHSRREADREARDLDQADRSVGAGQPWEADDRELRKQDPDMNRGTA
jgi:hypothetical protein